MSTDLEWEKWGSHDPYFAVITESRYRSGNLTDALKSDFFASGERHVERTLAACREYFGPQFRPRTALDFGCGVGRIVLPLAAIAEHVVGVDVSPSMLQEAAKNCRDRTIHNVAFAASDDGLSQATGPFDFIHSHIVMQHIPAVRGRQIFRELVQRLAPGGVACIHVTYANGRYENSWGAPPQPTLQSLWKSRLKKLERFVGRTLLGAFRQKRRDPEMQMNSYNLNELLFVLHREALGDVHLKFIADGDDLGVCLFFRRPAESEARSAA